MKSYWPLFSKFKLLRLRYGISTSQGRVRGDTPYSFTAENPFSARQFSSLGVNLVPAATNDSYSDGFDENPRDETVAYGKNTRHFQYQSSQTSHYATNEWTRTPNLINHAIDKNEANLQHTGYFQGEKTAAFQPISNHQTASNMYMGNAVVYSPVQEHVGPRSGWNSNHLANTGPPLASSSGYRNVGSGPHQQNFNGGPNSNVLRQTQVSNANQANTGVPPGGYQQEQVGVRSGWNTNHVADTDAPLANSSGYRNVGSGPHQQNFNGAPNSNVFRQIQVSNADQANTGVLLANCSGYRNVGSGPHLQNFNGTPNPNVLPQSQVSHTHQANTGVPLASSSGYRNVGSGSHQQTFNGAPNHNVLPQSQESNTHQANTGYRNAGSGPHQNFNGTPNPNSLPQSQESNTHQENTGYRNVGSGPHLQNFNGTPNPNLLLHSQVSNNHYMQSAGNDEFDDDDDRDVEGTLEELELFCKEWDLEHAVRSMRKITKRGGYVDLPRYMILIDACGKAKALKEAQDVHQHLINFTSPVKVSILNKILEMYGKCGSMKDAYTTFNNMPERNLTSWDTMITWFTRNGLGEDAIDMFTKLKEAGLKPDGEIFLSIFDTCGVLGDTAEGLLHFEAMSKEYGIAPTMAHYASIVHMFGSAGDLDGALEFIEKMPVDSNIDVWESLMNIARVQGNIDLGDRCAQIVEHLDPARLTQDSKNGLVPVKDDAPKKKVKKYNPLEHTKHEYRAGDRSHPENDKIYTVLRGLKETVKEAGYIAETKFVLHDIDQEGKQEAIMAHSERLACTYALLTSAPRMPLRIIKNLRVCGDCHNYFKIISSLVGREIVMRDAKRFHHFKDGKCSCNDYW